MYPDIDFGRGCALLLGFLAVVVPLAIWKVVDLACWIFAHVHLTIR